MCLPAYISLLNEGFALHFIYLCVQFFLLFLVSFSICYLSLSSRHS